MPTEMGIARHLLLGVALAVLLVVYGFTQGFSVRLVADVLLWGSIATAWNIIGGQAGYVSLASHGFYGLGAYMAGLLLLQAGWDPVPAIVVTGVAAAVFGGLVGLPVLRLRGHYLILGSLAVAEALRQMALNVRIEGMGAGGVLQLPLVDLSLESFNRYFYLLMVGLWLVSLTTFALVNASRLGIGLRAIRQDEDAAAVLGVPTTLYKVVAFALTSGLTAMAGSAWGMWTTHIEPGQVFGLHIMIQILVMTIVGGIGTYLGPTVGAFIVLWLGRRAGGLQEWSALAFGVGVLLMVRLAPKGLVDVAGRATRAAFSDLRGLGR
jgi:branched-chain amino acid transport system permease protein